MQEQDSGQTAATRPSPTTTVKVSKNDALDVYVVGEGTPVVLVHGAFFWYLLKPLAEALAALGHQAIWYHRRGYDGKPTEPVAVAEQALDVVRILYALDIDQAHLVGHSAGSSYVLEAAARAQDRLLSAAFLDFVLVTQVESGHMLLDAMRPSIEKAQAGDFEGAAATFLLGLGCTKQLMDQTLPGSWQAMVRDAPTWFLSDAPALNQWTPDVSKVKSIEIPVALLSISGLPPFRETAQLLQQWLPHMDILQIPTDHHFFPVTATQETAAAIHGWIQQQATPKIQA